MNEELIRQWVSKKAVLKKVKSEEADLRIKICESILKGKTKGTETAVVGNFKVKAKAKLNNKLEKETLKTLWKDLSDEEKECVKIEPKLVAAKYKKIKNSALLHQTVISKPGMPTLDVEVISI